MTNPLIKNNFTFDKVTGNIKPFILLVAAIGILIVTIIRDYKRYHQTYIAHPVSEVHKIGPEEVELTKFVFKPALITGQKKGGVALYTNTEERTPAAILIVSDMDDFVKTFNEKGKIVVKQFSGGVMANTDEGAKEFINAQGLKNEHNQYLKIFTFGNYFSWKTVLWQYVLFFLMIAFITFILVSGIRVL